MHEPPPWPSADPGPSSRHRSDPEWVEANARRIVAALTAAWERGWQPRDVDWVLGRRGRVTESLVRHAIAVEAELSAGPDRSVPADWRSQLDALASDLPHHAARRAGLIEALGAAPVASVHELSVHLELLPQVPVLVAPPSSWGPAGTRPLAGPTSTDVLERVRALLAKAESTEFEAEAEAFTAKAQELITRHSIDVAVLGRGQGHDGPPVAGRTVHIEDPYARERWYLLSTVARANGCRTIYSPEHRIVTCFGLPDDLDAVELLYTSLLLQATNALLATDGPRRIGRHGSSAKASFRRSFLIGFAHRIGERLDEAREQAERRAARDLDVDLLPVLASRDDAVAAAAEAAFPHTRRSRFTVGDPAGAAAGDAAGARATLSDPSVGATPRVALGGRTR